MRRWIPWLALPVVLVAALILGRGSYGPRTPAERSVDLSSQLRCPTCQGQSVLDSNAPAAEAIRTEIRRRVDAGESDEEILAYIDGQFADSLLLTPPRSGVGALVWILPVAGAVIAVTGLGVAFRRWRADSSPEVTDDDRRRVAEALHPPT
ncbi:cytochrome c-type biogenesis protein CcmH [soil metagenome]